MRRSLSSTYLPQISASRPPLDVTKKTFALSSCASLVLDATKDSILVRACEAFVALSRLHPGPELRFARKVAQLFTAQPVTFRKRKVIAPARPTG